MYVRANAAGVCVEADILIHIRKKIHSYWVKLQTIHKIQNVVPNLCFEKQKVNCSDYVHHSLHIDQDFQFINI